MKSSKGNVWAEKRQQGRDHHPDLQRQENPLGFSNVMDKRSARPSFALRVTKASHQAAPFASSPDSEGACWSPPGGRAGPGPRARGSGSQGDSFHSQSSEDQVTGAFTGHQAQRPPHACGGFNGLINNTPLFSSPAQGQLSNTMQNTDHRGTSDLVIVGSAGHRSVVHMAARCIPLPSSCHTCGHPPERHCWRAEKSNLPRAESRPGGNGAGQWWWWGVFDSSTLAKT